MKKFIRMFAAAMVAVVVGLTSFTPASAMPVVSSQTQLKSDVELAKHRKNHRPRYTYHNGRRYERIERRNDRRGYWHGYQGYKNYRPGYRRHSDGFYYRNEVFRLYIR